MSTNVSFIFRAINKFSSVSKKIKADTEKNTRAFKKLRDESKRVEKQSKKTAETLKRSGGTIIDTFKRMAAAALIFVSATAVLDIGGRFQDAIANLASITGASGSDLKFMSDETLRLAKNAGIAQDVVANAFTDIASAKSELLKNPKALSNITEQALLLANATGIDVPSAVQASVGALNQFGEGADQAARFVNVLAAGAKVGASMVSDTVLALKNTGTVASRFNVTFEETNSLIQVLAKNGVKGAEAGTALRGSLSKLEKFTNGRMSKMGIIKALEDVKKKGLSNIQIIKEFGEENLRSILILKDSIPLIKQWTKAVQEDGVAQEQASLRMSTFNAKLRKMGVTLKGSLIKVFLRMEPILTQMVSDFTQWIESIDDTQLKQLADTLVLVAKSFNAVGSAMGSVINTIASVGGATAQQVGAIATGDFSQGVHAAKLENTLRFDTNSQAAANRLAIAALVDGAKLADHIPDRFLPGARAAQIFSGGQGNPTENNDTSWYNDPVPADWGTNRSTTDINVNINAPDGVVKTANSKSKGTTKGLNVGVNMVPSI